MKYLIIGSLILMSINITFTILEIIITKHRKNKPKVIQPKPKSYTEIVFKSVDGVNRCTDEVTFVIEDDTCLEELYVKINTGLIVLGYTDKCLESYLGVEE